jgi:hypothetical protein
MSSFFSLYSKGYISMVAGPLLVVVGLVTGLHLMVLGGVAGLGWGIYRFRSARAAGR